MATPRPRSILPARLSWPSRPAGAERQATWIDGSPVPMSTSYQSMQARPSGPFTATTRRPSVRSRATFTEGKEMVAIDRRRSGIDDTYEVTDDQLAGFG